MAGPRGEHLRASMPHGHSKATTFIGGLRLSGMTAPLATAWFLVNVKQILVQTLASGDIVILDNLAARKSTTARAAIETAGAQLLFLPPYSPYRSKTPFPKLKALLLLPMQAEVCSISTRNVSSCPVRSSSATCASSGNCSCRRGGDRKASWMPVESRVETVPNPPR